MKRQSMVNAMSALHSLFLGLFDQLMFVYCISLCESYRGTNNENTTTTTSSHVVAFRPINVFIKVVHFVLFLHTLMARIIVA